MWSPWTLVNLKFPLAVLLAAILSPAVCQQMGPFKVVFKTLENCGPTSGKRFLWDFRFRKYNRTIFVVDANVTLPFNFGDKLNIVVEMSQFTNGGWKDNFFKQSFQNACSTTKFYGNDFITTVMKNAGLKPKCPIPKGNYSVVNVPLSMDVPGVPAFFYNKYKWKGTILEGNRIYGCIGAIVDVVPKKH